MATPTAVWSSVRNDTDNAGKVDLNNFPVNFAGDTPLAGDVVIVTSFSFTQTLAAPVLTAAPGWSELYSYSFLLFGSYGSVVKVFSKVLTQADVNAKTATVYTVTGEPVVGDYVAGAGVRGAAYGSLIFGGLATLNGTTDISFPSLVAPADALVIRASVQFNSDIVTYPNTFPNTFPAGWVRFGLDDNNGPGDTFPYFWHVAPAPLATAQTGAPTTTTSPNFGFTISLSDTAGPDETAPTITSSATPSVSEGKALSHTLTADEAVTWTKVGGANAAAFTLTGNTLSLPSQTYPSGPFVVTVRATDAAGNWSEQTITVTVLAAPISFVGAAAGTTTPVLPAHQAGDLLVCFMFRDGNATAPALPAGWTSAATGAGTTCSYRLAYKIATSSSESGGGATTATTCITSVYRPKAGFALLMGAVAPATGTAATLAYPGLTLQNTDGTSWVGAAAGHRSTNTAIETPPAGMVLRNNSLDTTDEGAAFDTDGGVTSWAGANVPLGGTASGWAAVVYEIKAAPDVSPPAGGGFFQAFIIG